MRIRIRALVYLLVIFANIPSYAAYPNGWCRTNSDCDGDICIHNQCTCEECFVGSGPLHSNALGSGPSQPVICGSPYFGVNTAADALINSCNQACSNDAQACRAGGKRAVLLSSCTVRQVKKLYKFAIAGFSCSSY